MRSLISLRFIRDDSYSIYKGEEEEARDGEPPPLPLLSKNELSSRTLVRDLHLKESCHVRSSPEMNISEMNLESVQIYHLHNADFLPGPYCKSAPAATSERWREFVIRSKSFEYVIFNSRDYRGRKYTSVSVHPLFLGVAVPHSTDQKKVFAATSYLPG
jgi:hypothetical protein